jgi:hypothetical protein
MSAESDIVTLLTASTAVSDAIGNKIMPAMADQDDTLPYVLYDRLSSDLPIYMGGGAKRQNIRVAFDCFANTYSSAHSIADVLYDRLHGKAGLIGNTRFDSIFIDNQFDDFIPPTDASDTGIYVASLTINCWHAATVPSSL